MVRLLLWSTAPDSYDYYLRHFVLRDRKKFRSTDSVSVAAYSTYVLRRSSLLTVTVGCCNLTYLNLFSNSETVLMVVVPYQLSVSVSIIRPAIVSNTLNMIELINLCQLSVAGDNDTVFH